MNSEHHPHIDKEKTPYRTKRDFLREAFRQALQHGFAEDPDKPNLKESPFPNMRVLLRDRFSYLALAGVLKYGEWRIKFIEKFYPLTTVDEILNGPDSNGILDLLYILFIATRRD